jgi:DNA polymerase-1
MKTDGQRQVVFLDIETNRKASQIWLCVTKDQKSGVVECHRKADTLLKMLEAKPLLVAHNGIGFDYPVLNRLWNTKIVPSMCIDTLVMSRLMNPNRENGHSLAAWATSLGTEKIDFQDFDAGWTQEMQDYCIRDVEVLEKVYNALLKEKEQYGFSEDSVELEHKVSIVVAKQERRGFGFDLPNAMVLLAGLKDKMAQIQASLHDIFPTVVTERTHKKTGKRIKDHVDVFNPGSRQQIAKRLKEKGWLPTKFTEKGQVIVDESTLAGVDIPEAKAIAEYLLIQKRVAMVDSWIKSVSDANRIHGKVITNGAVTGRMTHHSPNMAQVPSVGSEYGPECRSLFKAQEGYKLVGVDAASLELRMLAHYMKDKQYAKEIVEGDIHTKNQLAAGLQTRAQAKTFIYALLYGAGPAKIGKIVGGSEREGKRLTTNFLRNTPALQQLRKKVESLSKEGTLPGLDGRKLFIRSAHAALNTLLQSAGAIVMKKALVLLDEQLRRHKLDAHFVANVHDEFQIEAKEEHAQRVGELAVDSIRKAGIELGMRCPLDGEYKIGDNWCQTH